MECVGHLFQPKGSELKQFFKCVPLFVLLMASPAFICGILYVWQELGPNAICLVFDPLKTTHGKLWLKALRLQDKFMQMYKAGDFTQEAYGAPRLWRAFGGK